MRNTLIGRGAVLAAFAACLLFSGSANAQSRTGWWGVFTPVEGPLFDGSTGNAHRERPPLKGEYAKRYDQNLAKLKSGAAIDDPVSRCFPSGVPRVNFEPGPMELIVTPKLTWIVYENSRTVRVVYTDGSSHPEDPDLSWRGHSVGRWQGDTLVVDTTALSDNLEAIPLLRGGELVVETRFRDEKGIDRLTPHSDQLRVTERIRLRDADTLENEITVRDSKALSRPWKTVRTYKRQPGASIEQDNCEERQSAARAAAAAPR